MRVCSVEGCNKPFWAKDRCHSHYDQQIYFKNLNKNLSRHKEYYKNNKYKVKEYRERNKNKISNLRRNPENRFRVSKNLAKYRNLSFTLTFEEYKSLISKPCYYCEGEFGKVETSLGLDRIDNGRGYELDNVLSCCTDCNRTRGDRFTVAENWVAIQAVRKFRKNS